jgi:hypothetical protein
VRKEVEIEITARGANNPKKPCVCVCIFVPYIPKPMYLCHSLGEKRPQGCRKSFVFTSRGTHIKMKFGRELKSVRCNDLQ